MGKEVKVSLVLPRYIAIYNFAIQYDTLRHEIDIVVSMRIRGARGIPAARGTIAKNVCRVYFHNQKLPLISGRLRITATSLEGNKRCPCLVAAASIRMTGDRPKYSP